ncbi:hypothetical protein K438DRAFT_1993436 [Mycena galopus ATCC 62051]|nr:hypothetical protein K438DRAFT_1993436 [Mycena galopus ATCC 62051]
MTSIPRLDYTGILTTPFRDFWHIPSGLCCNLRRTPITSGLPPNHLTELAIHPEYSTWLLVQLPAHPDVSVSHPVETSESFVHPRSSPAFILSIPAIFEHSRPTLIMTYVLGDAPYLRTNFRSTLALALNSILFRFLPGSYYPPPSGFLPDFLSSSGRALFFRFPAFSLLHPYSLGNLPGYFRISR